MLETLQTKKTKHPVSFVLNHRLMSDPILNCQVNILSMSPNFLFALQINPQAPVAQEIADKVIFRRFQGEGVEFV